MTEKMLVALEQGSFEDVEWVDRLLHRFADYYFDALSCYERAIVSFARFGFVPPSSSRV
jgi:hypothetical protein